MTGERASCGCFGGGLHRWACASVGHVDPPRTPAPVTGETTDAGEGGFEALAYEHREDALTCYDHPGAYCCVCGAHEAGGYRSHLAAVLSAAATRAADDRAERIAQAIEAEQDFNDGRDGNIAAGIARTTP